MVFFGDSLCPVAMKGRGVQHSAIRSKRWATRFHNRELYLAGEHLPGLTKGVTMKKCLNLGVGIALILLFACTVFAQTKTDEFFPDSTKGYVAISNVNELRAHWRQTALGQVLLSDSFMEFRKSLLSGVEKAWTGRVGMSISDTIDLASGEAAFGFIANPGQTPGFVVAIDVTDKKKEVDDFLSRLIRQAFEKKTGTSKKETIKIKDRSVPVTVMIFPPDNNYPAQRTAYYVLTDRYLIASDQKELIQQMLSGPKPLASLEAYSMAMQRCSADFASSSEPQMRFFVQPLELGKAITLLAQSGPQSRTPQNLSGDTPFDILANHGLDAIEGVGGTIDFATDNMEFVTRTKVYAPEGLRGTNMLTFIDDLKLVAPEWVESDVGSTTVANIDLLNLFNRIGPLFDDFLKTKNLWEDTLKGLEEDEGGPRVNLKTQLVGNLGSQITTFRRVQDGKEAFVGGVQVRPGKDAVIADVFHRMFDTDVDFQQIPYGSGTIWYYAPQPKRQARSRRSPSAQQPASQPVFIRNAFYVGDGNIFFSTDIDALKEVIENKRSGSVNPLSEDATYQTVSSYIQKFSGSGHSFQFYAANHAAMKANYNMLRSGKLLEGNTLVSQILRRVYPDQNAEIPVLENASKLPPFESFESQMGATGAFGKNEPDGFFIKGFGLPADMLR